MRNRVEGLKVSHRLLLLLPVVIAVVGLFIGLDLNRTKQDLMDGRERALRNVVESAMTVLGHFYEQEQSKQLTHQQAQEQAKDALRAVAYDGGEGRMFVNEFSGVTLVNAVRETEGKNRLDTPNVRDQINLAKAGGGYLSYIMPIGPRTGDMRLAYVSAFKPWEWMVGSSVFTQDVNAIFWRVAAVQIGIAALTLVIASAAVLLIARSISRPMAHITASMGSLANGDLEVAVPFVGQNNEFGRLGAALKVFKDNALAVRDLRAEQEATRAASELERSRIEAERAREAAEDQVAIGALAQGLEALAVGDLTYQIMTDVAPKTQQLKDNFNKTAARLQDTMTNIAGAIEVMTNGTKEISQAADDLSRRTEQQAASLEETAAALDEITATVRKTAEGAVRVQGVVSSARDDAQHSNEVVRDAVSAMGEIEKSSHQVSQIISVIDEIAFQTNLLALNAGVEAARAGDAGRGFAVVASEVRALAQRSATAAKEIKTLISASSTHVNRGVKLVDETGQSLQRIVGHVGEVHAAITEIAASAKEQATGLHEVNTAVNQMDQVTQQNAAMVEQSTAASHSMAQETEALKRLTDYFQIDTGQFAAPSPVARPSHASRPVATRGAVRGARLG